MSPKRVQSRICPALRQDIRSANHPCPKPLRPRPLHRRKPGTIRAWTIMKYRGHTSLCAIAFCLVLCAVANDAQADWGLRVGGVHAATELDDSPGYGLSAFIRPSLSPRYRVEFNAGYGRLRGADYATDLASGEGRLLYALRRDRLGGHRADRHWLPTPPRPQHRSRSALRLHLFLP